MPSAQLSESISRNLFADETALVRELAEAAHLPPEQSRKVTELAKSFVSAVRAKRHEQGSIDAFMQQYSLSSEEGVVLMCLAEALLRIPDAATADKLILDKIGGKDWQAHLGRSDSLFVNASAWGLMLTGKIVELGRSPTQDVGGYLKRMITRSGEPVIRGAMKQAMRIMGKQFVLGRTIDEALKLAKPSEREAYRFSYDMLGEGAMTAEDAARYFEAYRKALKAIGQNRGTGDVFSQPSISVKLSALHPRYEERQSARVFDELLPRVLELAELAKSLGVGFTLDAEESNRLEISLELFNTIAAHPPLAGWDGLGLAVQAYGRRALPVLRWLAAVAEKTERKLPVRLVKGAYWDTEIKRAQEAGLESYPVFTRKVSTDVSYLACAKYLLENRKRFYPQFATHNAHTVAAIQVMAGPDAGYEFQRLHGMGQALYEQVTAGSMQVPCRIYAPVGAHEDLLAYLVRRLLENGANTSFVNRLADDDAPIADIIADPVAAAFALGTVPNARIAAPRGIYGDRPSAAGVPIWDKTIRSALLADIEIAGRHTVQATPLVAGKPPNFRKPIDVRSPQNRNSVVGTFVEAEADTVRIAMSGARAAQIEWDRLGGAKRGSLLETAAQLFERDTALLLSLLIREAGKTLDNAIADLRESVDFLRYYSAQALTDFNGTKILPGPTGERNELSLHGRGVFAAISPWNFPLAIFTGQVAAALAAGNAVVAKPAEQTPLVAHHAIKLMLEAGVPGDVLHFLPGDGAKVGGEILKHAALSGVVFTGSNDTATIINRVLAQRDGGILPLIAETGGMNGMIIDSSALIEQTVRDAVASAFDSAGQRCSAARIVFVQDDIAHRFITMLKGAMAELTIGDPINYATDVGPVIDAEAQKKLDAHKARMAAEAKTLIDLPLPRQCEAGTFVAPAAYELSSLAPLRQEVFGPVLHVVRFSGDRLADVCDQLNSTGYGLTLGVHTRIEQTAAEVRARIRVGNMYVNRNQIGAVVEAQPFGGEGLSGTGPKAGGPHYLHRFATERVCSTDTTASGGNAALMSIGPDAS
jgi:RHH-type transcriptional regulator, proline utilization regulon repressor / proline dehydrogenase / delta 1-pyrroline-5-carboxylate dehydrogenase